VAPQSFARMRGDLSPLSSRALCRPRSIRSTPDHRGRADGKNSNKGGQACEIKDAGPNGVVPSTYAIGVSDLHPEREPVPVSRDGSQSKEGKKYEVFAVLQFECRNR
jgi:hypothetical protein